MMLLRLVEQIRRHLRDGAYSNEAAISHSIVVPVLRELGWDIADPSQLKPEYTTGKGRADFALIGLGSRPAIFIEVKAVGLAANADRQLFGYAYEEGVPLCVLTDGREWSFFLPADQGSREERRVYFLQLDDREPAVSAEVLTRYLARDRVRNGSALDEARNEHRVAARRREAVASIPRAWIELTLHAEEALLEIVAEKAEAISGFRPEPSEVRDYLRSLKSRAVSSAEPHAEVQANRADIEDGPTIVPLARVETTESALSTEDDLTVVFTLLGKRYTAANASHAMREVLSILAARNPSCLPKLADAVRTPKRNYIANRLQDIAPESPPLSKGLEFATGWFVGTQLSNKRKMWLIRAAAETYGLRPGDLQIALRNG